MTETTTAGPRVGMTLELEPEPINAPARVEQRPTAPPAAAELVGRSPLDQITELLNRGITVEMLDQFLQLQHKWEAEEARKAYNRAMSAFKRDEIPAIEKKVHVDYPTRGRDGAPGGRVVYDHETLDAVVFAVLPPMARHGLTHKWVPHQSNPPSGMITVRCIITHELGHSEEVELSAAPDTSGYKNPIQAVKSAITYLERITLLAITGLAAQGMDDDGRSTGEPVRGAPAGKPATAPPRAVDPEPQHGDFLDGYDEASSLVATSKQVGLILRRAEEAGVSVPSLLERFQVADLTELPRGCVDDALEFVRRGAKRAARR